MSREKGLISFSGNFEPEIATPFDARMIVETVADLVKPETWTSLSGNIFTYRGMLTVVTNDPIEPNNGIYRLRANPYTNPDNWVLEGSGGGGYSKQEADEKFGLKEFEHTHDNKEVIDELQENLGLLTYKNSPILVQSKEIYRTISISNNIEQLVFNIIEICDEENITTVTGGYITMENTNPSTLRIRVGDVDVLNSKFLANDQQGYKLFPAKTSFIYASGTADLSLTIIGY